jgi:hypothetical protein
VVLARNPTVVVTRVPAPKGVILVEDFGGGELPLWFRTQRVVATATCLVVACSAQHATEIRAGDLKVLPVPTDSIAFDGKLATPSHKISVRTIMGATLLEILVPTACTHVRIWTNGTADADQITLGVNLTPPDAPKT